MSKVSSYEKALQWLARREHSERELIFKLTQKGFDASEITATIQQLKDRKYLDEVRFIGCIIRARKSQGLGPLRILAELKEHQITASAVENHEEWQKISWYDQACGIKERRFGKETCIDFKQQQKQKLFLQRRGFTLDQIKHAFSETSFAEG